jgi:hypothetical protein
MRKSTQSYVLHNLSEWDVNHDRESMDCQSDSAQSENRHLYRENRAYVGDEYHDENVGQN